MGFLDGIRALWGGAERAHLGGARDYDEGRATAQAEIDGGSWTAASARSYLAQVGPYRGPVEANRDYDRGYSDRLRELANSGLGASVTHLEEMAIVAAARDAQEMLEAGDIECAPGSYEARHLTPDEVGGAGAEALVDHLAVLLDERKITDREANNVRSTYMSAFGAELRKRGVPTCGEDEDE